MLGINSRPARCSRRRRNRGRSSPCSVSDGVPQARVRGRLERWNCAWKTWVVRQTAARQRKTGVREEVSFKTEIALEQVTAACAAALPRGVDAGALSRSALRSAGFSRRRCRIVYSASHREWPGSCKPDPARESLGQKDICRRDAYKWNDRSWQSGHSPEGGQGRTRRQGRDPLRRKGGDRGNCLARRGPRHANFHPGYPSSRPVSTIKFAQKQIQAGDDCPKGLLRFCRCGRHCFRRARPRDSFFQAA